MSKRRKRIEEMPPEGAPRPTGTALLISELAAERLDLHGLGVREAETKVHHFLERHVRSSSGRVVHIITGKGTHSDGPPVLPTLVNRILSEDFADDIVEKAAMVGGGAIAVRIK